MALRRRIEAAVHTARKRIEGLKDTDATVLPVGDVRLLLDTATLAFAMMEDLQREYQRMMKRESRARPLRRVP